MFTSREFNQDTGRAKRAAEGGPVFITDRGKPSHVLMTLKDYERLQGPRQPWIERYGNPAAAEVEVDFTRNRVVSSRDVDLN